MKRDGNELQDKHRIDNVLSELADRGVVINIIVYREIEGTLYVLSGYVKKWFEDRKIENSNRKIFCVRHPRYMVHFWSHHEKMVNIDGEIQFMGGLDNCFGRYEKEGYPLFDDGNFFPGLDYSNPRIKDIVDPKVYD